MLNFDNKRSIYLCLQLNLTLKKSNTQNLCISPLNKCTFKRFFGSFVRKREFDWVNEKCSLEFFKNVCIFQGIQLQPYLSYHLYLYTVSRVLNFGAPRLLNPGTFTQHNWCYTANIATFLLLDLLKEIFPFRPHYNPTTGRFNFIYTTESPPPMDHPC